jgi:hypothetical protein
MSNYVTPIDDDGFSGSLNSGRVGKGSFLKWNDSQHWLDRDGLVPPSLMLVVAVNEILQRWHEKKPEVITDKPLPDPEELNSAIPIEEWEIGIDGKPRKPWQHVVVVYLVNLGTGEFYTYSAATIGAHMAYDHLKEAVITMRTLRGTKCMPLVNLAERPMKTNFGMRSRPHFEIVGWKTPGEDGGAQALPPTTSPAQLAKPAPKATEKPAVQPATQPRLAKPKPPIQLSDYTLAVMGDVKPPTTEELLDDSLDGLPWPDQ